MILRKYVLASLVLALSTGCPAAEDAQPAPGASPPREAASPAAAPVPAPGPQPGRWAGVVTEGFKGDSIQFTVSPAGVVSDVVLSGHWRCSSSTSSSRTIQRMDVGHVPGTFAIGEDGTFSGEQREPYLLWTVSGQFTSPSAASGTIRVEYHTECDTHRLNWTAVPVQQ